MYSIVNKRKVAAMVLITAKDNELMISKKQSYLQNLLPNPDPSTTKSHN